jgi:hypothetical protein
MRRLRRVETASSRHTWWWIRRFCFQTEVISPLTELQRPQIVEVHDSLDSSPCSNDNQ